MSRIVTSVASFSRQRAAVWRACSSGVSSVSLASSSKSVRSLLGRRIETQARDSLGHARRKNVCNRFAARNPSANPGRGDRNRLQLELDDPVARGEPLADARDVVARNARTHGDRKPNELENAPWGLPALEGCELVGSED